MSDYQDAGFASADGLSLYARDYGAAGGERGLPVVCLHGLTRNSADFEDVAPWIAARGRRVLALDFRGRGRSERDPQPMNYHPATYAADVRAGMAALGVERAVFVGTSLGGLVTQVLATMDGAKVAAAVLNDVGPELGAEGIQRIMGYVGETTAGEDWDDAERYVSSRNSVAFPEADDAFWAVFARRLFREDEQGRVTLAYDPAIANVFRVAPTGPAPDLWPLFRTLTKDRPVLLIQGAISDLLTDEIVAKMRAEAPEMTFATVPNVGHAPMLSEPAAQAALAEFLDRVP